MVKWLARRPRLWWLFLSVGWFMWRVPGLLGRSNLSTFIRALRAGVYPRGRREDITFIANFWLRKFFGDRNTCYGRALTLYRFLNEPTRDVRLHMGIEPKRFENERLRGHAWVSVRGEIVEGPPQAIDGLLTEIPMEQYV